MTIGRPALRLLHHLSEPKSWFFSLARRRANVDLGCVGDLVQPLADRIKQEWAGLVLSRITLNADPVRHRLSSLVKTNPSDSTGSDKTAERLDNGRELQAS
jgi:hypothetical protein